MPRVYYQGAIANQLVIEELGNGFVLETAKMGPLAWPSPIRPAEVDAKSGMPLPEAKIIALQKGYNISLGFHYVTLLGECIVRNNPVGAQAVFNTKVDSTEEINSLKAMSETIAGCVAAGHTIKFNRTNLRNSLAMSYYKLGQAQIKSKL